MPTELIYKLTTDTDTTRGGCQWGEGIEHTAPGDGPLCSKAWIHAYRDSLLAVLMNPIHGNFQDPHLWECEAEIGIDDGTKIGCTRMTTLKRVPVPEVTLEQRVRFGILAAKAVYKEPGWCRWADVWLDGSDRSKAWAAAEAAAAAWAAAEAAANTIIDLQAIAKACLNGGENA